MVGTYEDEFFAWCGAKEDINFTVPPVNVAARFSVEYLLEHSIKNIGGKLPFGCHGWSKMSADFYINLFRQFGYDLSPLKRKMNNIDYGFFAGSLIKLAFQRLIRRVNRGQQLLRYLPKKSFASVRVIRSPLTMMLFSHLILEDNFLSDKVFFYNPDEQNILIQNLTPQNQPHLIINFGGHYNEFIFALEEKGFVYGKHVVSFQREYLNTCEKIFHNLGE